MKTSRIYHGGSAQHDGFTSSVISPGIIEYLFSLLSKSAGNIDGGSAISNFIIICGILLDGGSSITDYLSTQIIDGGNASSSFLTWQKIDCGLS